MDFCVILSVPVTGPVVAQRVGRGIALIFHDRGTRRGGWSAARPGRTLSPRKTREAGWAPGPVWTGDKSRPTGFQSPDRPARSSVAIPTELPSPLLCYTKRRKFPVTRRSVKLPATHSDPRSSLLRTFVEQL